MTKRTAAAALTAALLGLTGCGSAQPTAGPPSTLSDAPPNQVSGVAIPAGRIDAARAEKGRPVYEAACAHCHALNGADVGQVTPIALVGTDPERIVGMDRMKP